VSQKTGFKPAYIIQAGRTVLGDGGGVCQVSTTLFRALLDSGLEVTKRKQHSYRVSYYELDRQPGFDAAVFSGETDLRLNDSPEYVLLHFSADREKYMFVEIYGTSDGRQPKSLDMKMGCEAPSSSVSR
jgi:vancomycin resistance protein YoaR